MWFLSLTSAADAADAIDLELYDMGNAENARGAYGGERPEAIEPKQRGGDLWHIDRNALFLTNDRYYLRAIGSRESAGVSKQLVELQGRFHAGNAAASVKPWSQRLFVDGLGLPVGAVSFAKENAFSFAFANNLYSARRSDDSEWFVTVAPSDADADALAAQFVEGFASLGVRKPAEGIGWVEDRYLHDLSTAVSHGRFVLGVRGVKDAKGGKALLDELRRAVDALDEDAKSAALGGAAPDPAPAVVER
jgi:hypothetical protein